MPRRKIEELKDYTSRTVHEESGGRQRPTIPEVRGGENFRISKVLDAAKK